MVFLPASGTETSTRAAICVTSSSRETSTVTASGSAANANEPSVPERVLRSSEPRVASAVTCAPGTGRPRVSTTLPSSEPPRERTISTRASCSETSVTTSLIASTYCGWRTSARTRPGGMGVALNVPSRPETHGSSAGVLAGGNAPPPLPPNERPSAGPCGIAGTGPGITPSSPAGTSGRGPASADAKWASRNEARCGSSSMGRPSRSVPTTRTVAPSTA